MLPLDVTDMLETYCGPLWFSYEGHAIKSSVLYIHYSVIVSVCRGPCARGIYSTHGTNLVFFQQMSLINGPWCEKTGLLGFANCKGAEQPAHPRSLISAFDICLLKSVTSKQANFNFLARLCS